MFCTLIFIEKLRVLNPESPPFQRAGLFYSKEEKNSYLLKTNS